MTELTLQEQYDKLEAEKNALNPNNTDDRFKIKQIENRQAEIKLEMAQQEVEEAAQQRVEDGIKQAESILSDVSGVPLESLTENEAAATMIRLKVNAIVEQITESANEEIARLKEELRAADDREEQLQRQNEKLQQELHSQKEVINRLELEVKDALLKRDEAVRQRDEAVDEKEKLSAEVERLRSGREITLEEQTAQMEEARRKWEESRIKIVNLRWTDELKKTHYHAELADTLETITFSRLELGKYKVLDEEEAARFRAEKECDHENNSLDESEELVLDPLPLPKIEDVTFQNPTEVDGVQSTDEQEVVGGEGQNDPAVGTQSWQEWVDRTIKELLVFKAKFEE